MDCTGAFVSFAMMDLFFLFVIDEMSGILCGHFQPFNPSGCMCVCVVGWGGGVCESGVRYSLKHQLYFAKTKKLFAFF